MRLSLILICAFIACISAQCTVKTAEPWFKRSVYEFSTNLLTKIAHDKENHFVTSPLSAWTLLTSISLGASGTTHDELKRVLKLKNKKCFNNNLLKITTNLTSDINTDVVFERTSNIYVDEKLKITKRFKTKFSETGLSEIKRLSFENSSSAARVINDYVNRATHDTIDKIVSPGDLENVLMIIVDAIYFKGPWQTPFQAKYTEVKPFYNEQGVKIGNVNLMYLEESFHLIFLDDMKILELPYGRQDNRYSMLFFLPNDGVPLHSVIEKLKTMSLTTIYKWFEEIKDGSVVVQIPRFKITSDLSNLKELLIDMGLKTMFDSSEADFSIISHVPLYVSNLIQKTNIEVTEEGTVASAVTKADFGFRSMGNNFLANKPFLFMIVDKKIEIPIFTGAYSKPSLF